MIGKTINQYKILEKLGGGGMGVVYKAEDLKLERLVALKFLPPHLGHDEDEKKRFIHEAKAASALDHNNICNVHDIDETADGQLYIVMAYYAGETVKKKIDKGPLPIEEALDITLQIAKGLDKAHNNGILHRDVKPANTMVTEEHVVKIVDFGLAKLAGKTRLTKTGSTVGTVAYMSPEQGGGSDIDARSDLWSLGVVMYEMLTGQLPFQGDYEQAVIYSILNEKHRPISEMRKDLPQGLADVINKCLEKDPADRYETVALFMHELEGFMEAMKPKARISTESKRLVSRSSFVMSVTIILIAFLVVLWGGFFDRPSKGDRTVVNAVPIERHMAVLLLSTEEEDPHDKAFSKGLAETFTTKLTQLERLQNSFWVLPAGEVIESGLTSADDAWQKFKIRFVFTGSLDFNEKIILTLNLHDGIERKQIESKTIVAEVADEIAFQDSAVIVMARMLGIELSPNFRQLLAVGGTSKSRAFGLYLQARGHLQDSENMANIALAIGLLKEALELDPDYSLASASLGEAYWLKYQIDKNEKWIDDAQMYCDKALELAEMSDTHYFLGQIHFGTRQYDRALLDYERAIRINPYSDEAHRGIAQVYEKQNKPKDAEQFYHKAIQLVPGYWRNYSFLGAHYFKQENYAKAAEQFQKVVDLRPENIRGLRNLGGIYFFLDKWKEAKAIFERTLILQPDQVTYSNLGTILFYEGAFVAAAEMFLKALKMSPEDHRFLGFLAYAYWWIPGKQDEARELCRTAANFAQEKLKLTHNDPGLLCDLANYHAIIGNRDKAVAFLNHAIELGITGAELLYQVGEIYEQLGEREIALQWISDALDQGISMNIINHSPFLANLRSDERFRNVLNARNKANAE